MTMRLASLGHVQFGAFEEGAVSILSRKMPLCPTGAKRITTKAYAIGGWQKDARLGVHTRGRAVWHFQGVQGWMYATSDSCAVVHGLARIHAQIGAQYSLPT